MRVIAVAVQVISLILCSYAKVNLRVRLLSGNLVRFDVDDSASLADVYAKLKKFGKADADLKDNHVFVVGSTKVALSDMSRSPIPIRNLDFERKIAYVHVPSYAESNTGRGPDLKQCDLGMNAQTKVRRLAQRGGVAVSDVRALKEKVGRRVRINKYNTSADFTVTIDASRMELSLRALVVREYGSKGVHGAALLLGSRNAGGVQCQGAVHIASPPAFLQAPGTAVQLHQVRRLARLLGLDVVGCAIGSARVAEGTANKPPGLGSTTSRRAKKGKVASADVLQGAQGSWGWTVEHVRLALELNSMVRNATDESAPFVVLSVQGVLRAGDNSTLHLEAYRLTEEAVALQRRGQLLPKDPATAAEQLLPLSEPVVLGGAAETTSLDPALLVVPLPVINASCPDSVLLEHSFPSVLRMQADPQTADAAQSYLLRLLQGLVGGALSEVGEGWTSQRPSRSAKDQVLRLRDPHLLLFLSLLISDHSNTAADSGNTLGGDQSPFAALCRSLRETSQHRLRSGGSAAGEPQPQLSMQALAALEAARRVLQP